LNRSIPETGGEQDVPRPLARQQDASDFPFDTRIGLGASAADWSFQVAWVATEGHHREYRYLDHHRNGGVLSASYSF